MERIEPSVSQVMMLQQLQRQNRELQADIPGRKQTKEALQRYTQQLEALRQMSLELTAELDLDILLRSIVSRAMELLQGTTGSLFLLQPERNTLELAVIIGMDPGLVRRPALRRGEGLAGKVWETGEPIIVDNYQRWQGRLPVYDGYPFRAVIGMPVRWGPPGAEGEFLGVLNVLTDPPRTFSQADAELLSMLAAQAAIAIQNARLYKQAHHEIVERKRAEQGQRFALAEALRATQALQEAHAKLEIRVEERTAELASANEALQAEIAERLQAEEALRRYADRLRILHEIDQAILAAQSPEDIARAALSHVRRLIPCMSASVIRFDFLAGEIFYYATDRSDEARSLEGTRFPLKGAEQWIDELRRGRSHTVEDTLSLSPQPAALEILVAHGLRSYIIVPLAAQHEFIGALTLGADRPGAFDEEDLAIIRGVAGPLAIAIQNARLYEAEQRARRTAETLRAANMALTQTLDMDTVLETLLDYVGQLVPYDSANVQLLETDSRFAIRAIRGYERWTDPEKVRSVSFEIQADSIGQALITRQESILIPDTREHPDWRRQAGTEYVRNWIGVPLVAGGKVIGVYSLDKAKPDFFTQEHLQLAEALAGQAAVAIQNARLYEQVHTSREQLQHLARQIVTAEEEERRRLSRELHDEAGQDLTALKISLELIQEDLPVELDALRRRVGEAAAWTNETMEQIRLLAQALRPPALDAVGLKAALEGLCSSFAERTHLSIDFVSKETPEELPGAVTISLYRALQEALVNVARHAHASRVWVILNCDTDTVSLSVKDDGQGFDPQVILSDPSSSAGMGLKGIRERLSLLGGRLEIGSRPGQGTRLVAHIPWEEIT